MAAAAVGGEGVELWCCSFPAALLTQVSACTAVKGLTHAQVSKLADPFWMAPSLLTLHSSADPGRSRWMPLESVQGQPCRRPAPAAAATASAEASWRLGLGRSLQPAALWSSACLRLSEPAHSLLYDPQTPCEHHRQALASQPVSLPAVAAVPLSRACAPQAWAASTWPPLLVSRTNLCVAAAGAAGSACASRCLHISGLAGASAAQGSWLCGLKLAGGHWTCTEYVQVSTASKRKL